MNVVVRTGLVAAAVGIAIAGSRPADIGALRAADAIAGSVFLLAGILAAGRPGGARLAVPAAAAGLAWFAGNLVPELLFAYRPAMVAVILGYSDGRIRGWFDRVVLLVALPCGLIAPLARSPALTVVLGALLLAAAVGRTTASSATRSGSDRVAARAAVLLASALAAPAAARLIWSTSAVSEAYTLTNAVLVAAAGGTILTGLLLRIGSSSGVTDTVLELTDTDRLDRESLTKLAAPGRTGGQDLEPATAAAIRSGLELSDCRPISSHRSIKCGTRAADCWPRQTWNAPSSRSG